MDDRIKNIFKAPAVTEDERIERQAQQDFDAEEMKIAMMPPEQQQAFRQARMRQLMAFKPKDPLAQFAPKSPPLTPEEKALLDIKAREARKSFDRLTQPATADYDPLKIVEEMQRKRQQGK